MEQDSNVCRIDSAHHTLKQDSDFAKAIFESYLRLVHRWIPRLISHEALESIDADLLARYLSLNLRNGLTKLKCFVMKRCGIVGK